MPMDFSSMRASSSVLAVVTTVSLAVHRFFWVRLVRAVTTSPRLRRTGAVLFTALALSVPAGLTLWRFVGADTVRPVSFVGATWAGVLFLLLVCLLGAGQIDHLRS